MVHTNHILVIVYSVVMGQTVAISITIIWVILTIIFWLVVFRHPSEK